MAAVSSSLTPQAYTTNAHLTGPLSVTFGACMAGQHMRCMQRRGTAGSARLKGRSSTGVTLALPRSSGANAAAHARQAATLIHTRASIANSTWRTGKAPSF